ncbi:hypothetical protein BZA70DRAFT_280661 [Myxozyma melibiosi]|uniref:VPS9 domain-containing protein n=1 Tax=Myxozyma melibiosi TaxID=54550 RepID=A0ABR1F3I5_9ASCO
MTHSAYQCTGFANSPVVASQQPFFWILCSNSRTNAQFSAQAMSEPESENVSEIPVVDEGFGVGESSPLDGLAEPILAVDSLPEAENAWGEEAVEDATVGEAGVEEVKADVVLDKEEVPSEVPAEDGQGTPDEGTVTVDSAEADAVEPASNESSAQEEPESAEHQNEQPEEPAAIVAESEATNETETSESPATPKDTAEDPSPETAEPKTEAEAPYTTASSKLFGDDDKLFTDDVDPDAPEDDAEAEDDILGPSKPAVPIAVSSWTTKKRPPQHPEIPVEILTSSSAVEPKARASPAKESGPAKSFSRIPAIPEPKQIDLAAAAEVYDEDDEDDVFAKPVPEAAVPVPPEPQADAYQDLPPELVAMADRFVESIREIAPSGALSPERLSQLFQDFYVTVQDKAAAMLRRSNMRRTYEVQMVSFEEMARKKRERKQKEHQKVLYEELVERKVCSECYDDVFMYNASDDEPKDEALATKIAALKVINIDMEHLGVPELKDVDFNTLLGPAKKELVSLAEKRSPKEKLQVLISVHKHIVDVLSNVKQSNGAMGQSGADFVLPTLIYCVIQANPPHISSNMAFIQRFRSTKTINGETAYCLTNFEAVVAFLETVDLQTLNLDSIDIPSLPPVPEEPKIVDPLIAASEPPPLPSPRSTSSPSPSPLSPSLGGEMLQRKPLTSSASSVRSASSASSSVSNSSKKPVAFSSVPPPPAKDSIKNVAPVKPMPADTNRRASASIFGNATFVQAPNGPKAPEKIRVAKQTGGGVNAPVVVSASSSTGGAAASAPSSSSSRRSFYPTGLTASVGSTADSGIRSISSTFETSYKFLFGNKDNEKASPKREVAMRGNNNVEALERRTKEVLQQSSQVISTYAEGKKREQQQEISPPRTSSKAGSAEPEPAQPELPAAHILPKSRKQAAGDASFGAEGKVASSSSSMRRGGSNDSRVSPVMDDGDRPRTLMDSVRRFARSGSNPSGIIDQQPPSSPQLPKLSKPKFDDETLADASTLDAAQVDELVKDYQRMVEYLKTISAFEE